MEKKETKKIMRRWFEGEVVGIAGSKTIKVSVSMLKKDKKYDKHYKMTKYFLAHDESGLAKVGNFVRIVECRPISKTKRWRLVSIKKE